VRRTYCRFREGRRVIRQSEQPKRLDQDYEEHCALLPTDGRTGPVEDNTQLITTMQVESCSMELPLIPAHLAMALEFNVVELVASREVVKKKRWEIILPPLRIIVVQHQAIQEDTFTEI
jgi:hypothetical protein